MKIAPTFLYEQKYWELGKQHVAGVDEVGYGCFAGPVVAGVVIFPSNHTPHPDIRDSKLLSQKKRESLVPFIKEHSLAWNVVAVDVLTINAKGIVFSRNLAMQEAIQALQSTEVVLVDGNHSISFPPIPSDCVEIIVKGDQLSYSIAAASILAKVFRDELMSNLSRDFPMYEWGKNKGYGTKVHREAIQRHGICEHHRLQYVKRWVTG